MSVFYGVLPLNIGLVFCLVLHLNINMHMPMWCERIKAQLFFRAQKRDRLQMSSDML